MSLVVADMVDARLRRCFTQYRESPNLLHIWRTYLKRLAEVAVRGEAIYDVLDIDGEGAQLTLVGKLLGWPRKHCDGARVVAFGYECGDGCQVSYPVAGYCEGARHVCDGYMFEEYNFDDDDLYRRWLIARQLGIYADQTQDYTRDTLEEAATALWGDDVIIVKEIPGTVTMCLTRYFTPQELSILHLAKRVLPIAPGVDLRWAHSDGPPFGYGPGWGDICTNYYTVIRDQFEDARKSDLFGYGPEYSGYCGGTYGPGGPNQEI